MAACFAKEAQIIMVTTVFGGRTSLANWPEQALEDAIIYSYSESFQLLCANSWRDSDIDHENHESEEKHVVIGRIAAPGHVDPARLLDQLDKALASRGRCQLCAPDLSAAAGFS
jgi:hypothetical protein